MTTRGTIERRLGPTPAAEVEEGTRVQHRRASDAHRRLSLTLYRALLLACVAVLVGQAAVHASPASVVGSGLPSSGAVALTFDDGWAAAACERIASTLRRSDVVGTFFINGSHLRAEPARWRTILRGMPVANHTRAHPDLTTVSRRVMRNQIMGNERIHEQLLGRQMLKVLRPPYGAYDERVKRIAGRLGYQHIVLWSRSAADSSPAATVRSVVRRTTGAPPGSIILMHCGPSVTADALPLIIRHYQARGIRLAGLDEVLGLGRQP